MQGEPLIPQKHVRGTPHSPKTNKHTQLHVKGAEGTVTMRRHRRPSVPFFVLVKNFVPYGYRVCSLQE